MKNSILWCLAVALTFNLPAYGQEQPTEPVGGKPPAGAKPSKTDLDYQVKYQRAFEAVIWSMPAVGINGFLRGFTAIGGVPNVIVAYSKPAKPNLEALTANNQVPYLSAQTDLRQGPAVLEVPAATDKGSLYGQIVDHWQITIADIGPSGVDEGKGGKILLTPPGYAEEIPPGYIEVKSPSYRVAFAFRTVPGPESSPEEVYEYIKTMKMYYLSELPDPKPTQFVDPNDMRLSTLPFYDERWFEELHDIISVENVLPRDKVMMGMLASLGIQKGKPYNPDAKTKKAMRQAVTDAYFYMQQRFLHPDDPSRLRWKGKQWYDVLFCDENQEFAYDYEDRIDLDGRADRFYPGTFYPKKLSPKPAVEYVYAVADKDGNPLEEGKAYSLTMPAKVPVEQFWSLVVYDLETFAFIYSPQERPGLSSFDLPNMQKNSDGSVTLYFGPQPPKGLEKNWIPTEGKRPMPIVRFYGPTEEYFNKSWELPDVELEKEEPKKEDK